MKYVLILSLFYKHYKNSSTLRLFLDDQLIDEIVLDKNIDPIPNFQEKHSQTIDKVAVDSYRDATWVIKKLQTLKLIGFKGEAGWYALRGKQTHIKIPSKLWLYSLELNNTNKHISLNFEIHDNNYSNAFMTNSSLAKIHKIGLIPENLFYDEQKILPRICKTFRRKNIDLIHISKDSKNKKINKNDLELYLGDGWITKEDYISEFRYSRDVNTGRYSREYPFITSHKWKHCWFGGSKKIILPIIKKHNTFMLYCPLILYTSATHKSFGLHYRRCSGSSSIDGKFHSYRHGKHTGSFDSAEELAKHQKELIQNESQPSADAERADAARGMWQPIGPIGIDPYWFWLKYQQQIINITNEDSRNYNTQKNR